MTTFDAPPSVVSVAGTWSGSVTLTGATGGECVGPGFTEAVGSSARLDRLPISQTGDNVAFNLPLLFSSTDCAYTGTAMAGGVSLAAVNCGSFLSRRCEGYSGIPGDNRERDVSFISATFSGPVVGNALTATAIEMWNITLPGTQTSVGVLTLTSKWNLTR